MTNLVINVSCIISSLCYSVLRIEPYTTCPYECIYCYGRWYRPPSRLEPQPQYELVSLFKKVARKLGKVRVSTIPFRLSTLIEPLQPVEEKYKLSLKIMKTCLKNKIPLILSTKSTLFTRDEWFRLLVDLSSKNLVLLQVTLVTLDKKLQNILEPRAPSIEDRIEAIDKVAKEGVPVVIRYQPIIPGLVECEVKDVFKLVKSLRVKHVILEFLRCSRDELDFYANLAPIKEVYDELWESYSPERKEGSLVRPPLLYRVKTLDIIKKLARTYNVKIALCKEGLFQYDDVLDCCGIRYLSNIRLRLTLREVWSLLKEGYSEVDYTVLLERYGNNPLYITSCNVNVYPRILRKPLLHHEKVLKATITKPYLTHITPLLCVKDGKIRLISPSPHL